MDRNKKLIIVGAAGLFLLIAIIVLIALAVRNNKKPTEPEPTPIATVAPTPDVTLPSPTPVPTAAPTATIAVTPIEPGQPVLPGETTSPAPVETPAPSNTPVQATPKPTTKPAATSKPAAASFDFGIPASVDVNTKVNISTSAKGISSVAWRLIKKSGLEIEVDANNSADLEGTLAVSGGSITFKNTGSYILKAIATATDGKIQTVSREVTVTAATVIVLPDDTPAPTQPGTTKDGFAFGLPKTAYLDTVVTVSVFAGTEAVTWSVRKDGGELALADAFVGKLSDQGGMVVFKSEGLYILTGTTASGKAHSAAITVQKRAQ